MILLAQQDAASSIHDVAPYLFYAFAALTVLGAWAVVISQNIVRMAVWLLLTLGGIAGLYFMMHAELLAAVQLIVYVGGTLILIVFGVMLTSRNPFMQLRARGWEITVGIGVGATVGGLLLWAKVTSTLPAADPRQMDLADGYSKVETFGRGLLSTYMIPFEVAAVLLLVVMIGAAYMARRRTGE